MSGIVTCDKIVEALVEGLENATELEREGFCESIAYCEEDPKTPGEIVCEAFDEIIEVDEAPENGKVVFRTETGDCVVSELPEPKTPGEIVCEAFDEITEVDEAPEGAKVVVRDENGDCFVSPAPEGDSVVYNITELPEGAEAPEATASIIDFDTGVEIEESVPDPTGRLVASGAGAKAHGMLWEKPEGGYEGMSSLAIGGSISLNSRSTYPPYVPASSGPGGIAIFGQAGASAIAIGNVAEATDNSTVAIGDQTGATGYAAIAIGYATHAAEYETLAIGSVAYAEARSSTAVGGRAYASLTYSTALGYRAKTSKSYQVSIAPLDETTHLSDDPCLLSGVKTPEVGQDAANKDYVDNYIKAKVEALPEGATLEDLIAALKS